jgi:hypothetical protein
LLSLEKNMIGVAKTAAAVMCVVASLAGQNSHRPAVTLVPKLSLGRPVQVGTLAIVPIESTLPLAQEQYLTLAQAMKLGAVEIVEVPGQEQVNSLEVRNRSKLPILLFAGELLLGGKQDRIVAKDSIVPGNERRDVPVFCVEHGRWTGSPTFSGGDTFVNDAVRHAALSTADQSAVWSNVAATNGRVAAKPSTGTIRGTLNDPKVKAGSEKLYAQVAIKFKPTTKTVGVICWIDGKILSADVFANPALFAASRAKLFKSYTVDVQLVQRPKVVPIDLQKCSKFLSAIVSARRNLADRSAYGSTYGVQGKDVSGFESGRRGFGGGLGGGAASAGGAGFGHGTYKP